MTPIHKNLLEAVVESLQDIFSTGYYADKVIEYRFKKNKKWGSRDRKFIAEAVYDMVRWWRYLWYLADKEINFNHDDLVYLFFVWRYIKYQEVNELSVADIERIDFLAKKEKSPAVKESYPDWLYDLALREIGEDWREIAKALNTTSEVYLRTNTLKASRDDLIKALQEEGIEAIHVRDAADAVVIPSKKNVFQSKAFKNGYFEVQDVSSQMIAPLLKVKAGDRVVDACAGAGGKALHLATLMQNKGKLIALDIMEKKLEALKKRQKRNGIDIIETRFIESNKIVKRLKHSADKLLLDVPCSGLGVVRRNPDSKWKLSLERIEELKKIQQEILENYCDILKPAGRMVYATCSLLPSENEEQIKSFLEKRKDFKLLSQKTLRPDVEGYDGFYFAVLERMNLN